MQMQISLIFLSVAVLYVSSSPLESSCTVSKYEDVENAAKICSTLTLGDIVIPKNKVLNIPMKDGGKLVFNGHITHVPTKWAAANLIKISGNNIDVSGTSKHLLDGMGPQHWQGDGEKVIERPKFIRLALKNSNVQNLHLKNCPNNCMLLSSTNLNVHDIFIDNRDGYPGVAGKKFAKNTDGFGVGGSNIKIWNATVYNQDDCVVVTGGHDYHFENIHCNGSHGFSFSVRSGEVYNVEFKNSHIEHASNAIHIKTHNDNGGAGKIHNVTFNGISFNDIDHEAIHIQQNYPHQTEPSNPNIKITELTLKNIKGSVSGKKGTAISVVCAKGGCSNWKWSDIKITGAKNKNTCDNVPSGVACK